MTGLAETIVVEAARAEHAPELAEFFDRNHTACHCQWWHFTGDKNAWLDRCAHAPHENQAAFARQLAEAEALPLGVVARLGSLAVGWMKLAPAESVAKLYEQRIYRGLPCFNGDRTGVITVSCFLVDEAHRRQGIARRLLDKGVELARAAGASAIEAFPRRTDSGVAAELWTGPPEVFLAAGFEVVNDFRPYPVLRLALSQSSHKH